MLPLLTQLALHPPVALGSADDGPHRRTEDPNVYFWLTTKGPVARTELGSFKMYLGKGKPPIKDLGFPMGIDLSEPLLFVCNSNPSLRPYQGSRAATCNKTG